ncbi:translocation/assembly module TamB domain-containing protein [Joostella sp.]|uniref:translocation/assembly module TamB domain-containing protein n=1 Tax=Joostella sp. TaxID=2231138 RepID=UPI003A958B9D
MPQKQKFIKSRFLRIALRIVAILLLLFFVLVLVIRSPWGQNLIVGKAVNFLSNKIGTEVKIEKLFITFSGNASLNGFYIEDEKGDTLVYSEKLELSTSLLPLIQGTEIDLNLVDWSGLKANIERDTLGRFNFDYIVDAFASADTTQVDTTSGSMKISLGKIKLEAINLRYNDQLTGIDLETKLGELLLDVDVFDLDKMRFEVSDFEFNDGTINYTQGIPFEEDTDTTSTATMPFIRFDNVDFKNVEAYYNVIEDNTTMAVNLEALSLELPKLNLNSQEIVVDKFILEKTKFTYNDASKFISVTDTIPSSSPTEFNWPDWKITTNNIEIQDSELTFIIPTDTIVPNGFNASNLELKQLNFASENITYQPGKAAVVLNELSFLEHGIFHLKDLNFELSIDDKSLGINALHVITGNSDVTGSATMKYSSVEDFINNFEASVMDIRLPNFNINIKDAYYFQPDLAENKYIDSLRSNNIKGALTLTGTLDSLHLKNTSLNWGKQAKIALNGSIKSPTNADSLKLYIPDFNIKMQKQALASFVSEDSLGISIPDSLNLAGSLNGGLNNINTKAVLKTSDGIVKLNGKYSDEQKIAFDADLNVDQLHLGKILKNDEIGALSFRVKTSGSGNSINTLNAKLTSEFDSLAYANYDFSKLKLNGNIKNGTGDVTIAFKDDNLDFNMDTHMILDSLNSKFSFFLDLNGADLYKLGITKSDVRTGFKLKADYEGDFSNFILDGSITEGIAIYRNKSYNIDAFNFNAALKENSTLLKIKSNMLEADLEANTTPNVLAQALETQLSSYWEANPNVTLNDSIVSKRTANTTMKMKVLLRQTPALSEVYFPSLEEMDSVAIVVDFKEAQKTINADINAPYVNYNSNVIDSLHLYLDGKEEDLVFNLGWSGIESNSISIDKTALKGTLKAKRLLLDFNSKAETENLVQVNSEVLFKGDTIQYHIDPSTLILNRKKWDIPNSNEILYAPNFIAIKDFVFSNNGQEIALIKSTTSEEKDIVGVSFDNFKLNTILSFLNPDEPIAKGVAKGVLNIEDPFNNAGIQADLKVTNLEALKVPLGNLSINASSQNYSDYEFALALKEGNIDLDLTGSYIAEGEDSKLDLDLLLNGLKMKAIEGFSGEEITNTKGSISGRAKLTGTTANPIYSGKLNFDGVEMLVNQLNSNFSIDQEELSFDNNGFTLNKLSIQDEDKNVFVLDGKISTEDIANPAFDLTLKADNFKVLNSTREDNDLFYGNVSLNTDITIKGDLEVPRINGKLKIKEDSKFTVIVPESELDINEREGVVLFVNRKNENDILTRREEQTTAPSMFENFDIDALISVDKNSVFRIVINERSGDNLEVSGTGEFNFKMETNGRTTLSGQYEVDNGHYEASLYNIVKRKFDISKGSKITWNGDPLDASLDIKAIYNVETSASALMATQTSNSSSDIINTYRQKYPFLVYLNIDGELLEPELAFQLDMPEDEQSAASGNIYSAVQQLNEQEEELNKQVFSLLVMNRFFPTSGSDGSAGGPASIARDNVNDVLSDQLNTFSDKILGDTGVQLDFGLDSYTDYQSASPQERTELDINASKSLFDDRVIVQVGSEVDIQGSSQTSDGNAPAIGNVGIEYLVTEDGRYRLRGYRKNKFESIIDGELIVTGISIIFNKEFNKFKELWERKVREEVAKEKKLKEQELKEE